MARKSIFSVVLFASCILLLLLSSEKSIALKGSLSKYLPKSGEIGEWKTNDIPQEFKGEDLFLYINGGAEIYHEYGFKQVLVQDYINKNGKSVSLEIFEMLSSDSAFGIYTFKTSSEGKELALGDEGRLGSYYLNFWKGNFLVTLTGFDEDKETVEGLLEIARAVDAKIEIKGKKPSLVAFLPEKDLVKSSIKYFKGHLGLYNSYQFFTQDVFGLKEGIKGDYKAEYSVFIIKYEDNDECHKRYNEVRKSLKESSRYNNFRIIGDAFQVTDDEDKLIVIKSFRKYILIVLGTTSQSEAKKIMANIQENIRDK
ncbi:MAG: DUF6599 family protein [Candidatus Aminicenantia bacterium]